jgi:hypothetical protein
MGQPAALRRADWIRTAAKALFKGAHVTRRTFFSGITLGLLATPRGAEAQQARVYRAGVILQSLLARGEQVV